MKNTKKAEEEHKEVGLKESTGVGEENVRNLVVYNTPFPLYFRFLEYVKTHAGNKGWVAIEQLLDHYELSERVASIERRLKKIEELGGDEKK